MLLYNKIVRDHIPEIIAAEEHPYKIATVREDTYPRALLTKLVEEAEEAASEDASRLSTETADIYDVLGVVMVYYNLGRTSTLALQNQRQRDQSGFRERVILIASD